MTPAAMTPAAMTPGEAADALAAALAAVADPAKAGPMRAYMRDQFPFLGVQKPARVAATRDLVRALPVRDADWLHDLVRDLWARPEREHQYVAVDVLARHRGRLEDASLPVLRELVGTRSWWDSVDALAPMIGAAALEHPAWVASLRSWATAEDRWLRRVAIISQLGRGRATDLPRLAAAIEANLGDPEFFIRKAIGWALRDLARHDPDWVRDFVAGHPDLSPLSRREALKHL
jgi:3-methyladenine DNA glycosylase AlkD